MTAYIYETGALIVRVEPSPAAVLSTGFATLQAGLTSADGSMAHITAVLGADELRRLAATLNHAAAECEQHIAQALDRSKPRISA